MWNVSVGSARKAAAVAKSSGRPQRRTGVRPVVLAMNFSQPRSGAVMSVSTQPGMIALQRIPWRASSTANPRTSASTAAFEQE